METFFGIAILTIIAYAAYRIIMSVVYMAISVVEGVLSNIEGLFMPVAASRHEAPISSKYDSYYEPYEPLSRKPSKWYSAGQSVNVQGYDIPGGLIYVGESPLDRYSYATDDCLINPKLRVSPAEPWEGAEEMSRWPIYAYLSPKCRGAYLKWLAGGRSEPKAHIGNVILFFYGLERRLFVDGQKETIPGTEMDEIAQEVNRLLRIYGEDDFFRRIANNLLAMDWILYQGGKHVPAYIDFNDKSGLQPFQVVLAEYVAAGEPMPSDIALQWIKLHPKFRLRTPARRCEEEFKELFSHRYTQKFGEGMIVKPNKKTLRLIYRAASYSTKRSLDIHLSELPDPFLLTAPLNRLAPLAEECATKLDLYSRFLGRKNNDPTSVVGLALLPRELLLKSPAGQTAELQLAQACADGVGLMSVERLCACFDANVPLRINKEEAESLAALVEGVGFGMVPDVRFHNIKPSLDGKVVVFPGGYGKDFRPSREYQTLGTILQLGAMVSQIDGRFSPSGEAALQNLVNESRGLAKAEKASLLAFLQWCFNNPQGTAGIKQRMSEVSTAEKAAISRILISVACADGRIDPKQVKQLEKLYTTLGLNKEQVVSDLHTLATANEPVTVGFRDSQPSFTIPTPTVEPENPKGFSLNEDLIRARTEETRQVRGVLEGIFSEQEEEQVENTTTTATSAPGNPLAALDKAHQDFFHSLVQQEAWKRSSLHELCKELGLMVDGAMEVLNEWSFENANAPLIEDGDPIFVDVALGKEITDAR